MHIRWSPRAADDLARIIVYIRLDNPASARRVAGTIYARAGALRTFPERGRPGRVEGTRELALPPLPFLVVYRPLPDVVEIVAIIHGAQRWP